MVNDMQKTSKRNTQRACQRQRMGEIYGYVRVSHMDQNEDRQMVAMKEAGVPDDNIFMDKQSGRDFDRP